MLLYYELVVEVVSGLEAQNKSDSVNAKGFAKTTHHTFRVFCRHRKALCVCWRNVMQSCDVIFATQADSIPLVAF